MKTTLEIDDDLYRKVKALAALSGRKMKDIVSEGLHLVLQQKQTPYRQSEVAQQRVRQSQATYNTVSPDATEQVENWLDGWNCTTIDRKTGAPQKVSGKDVLQRSYSSSKQTLIDSKNTPIVGLLAKELSGKSVEEWMDILRGTP